MLVWGLGPRPVDTMQHQINGCGNYCLTIFLLFYRRNIDLHNVVIVHCTINRPSKKRVTVKQCTNCKMLLSRDTCDGSSCVMCFRWYSKMSKIIHMSLLSNVLQLVHCLTVTRFLLGRLIVQCTMTTL